SRRGGGAGPRDAGPRPGPVEELVAVLDAGLDLGPPVPFVEADAEHPVGPGHGRAAELQRHQRQQTDPAHDPEQTVRRDRAWSFRCHRMGGPEPRQSLQTAELRDDIGGCTGYGWWYPLLNTGHPPVRRR